MGTVEKRGISGGQKKRVNIGLEMTTDPTVLFLDEPTSGLGASDTLIVMKGLHSLTRVRRTVIAVIHQPRYQASNRPFLPSRILVLEYNLRTFSSAGGVDDPCSPQACLRVLMWRGMLFCFS